MSSNSAADIYSERYHAVHLRSEPSRSIVWRVIADHLSLYIPYDGCVLEIGAGYCDWINNVRARIRIAVDIWKEFPRYAAAGVYPIIHDLSCGLSIFGDNQFDTVLASNVIEHFSADVGVMLVRECCRILRPSGRMIIVQPNFAFSYKHYFDDYTHRAVFTHVSLSNMLKSQGFQIDDLKSRFTPYSLRDIGFPVYPFLIKAYLISPLKPFAGQMLVVARKP